MKNCWVEYDWDWTEVDVSHKLLKNSICDPLFVIISSLHNDFDLALKSPNTSVKDDFRCLIWLRSFSKFS